MTGQLIEVLAKKPADMPVLVEGYETGLDEALQSANRVSSSKPGR